jgi:predicted nicotinamide N-methyase
MKAERPTDLPPMPETPWDALGKMLREQVIIDEHTFLIQRPDESDKLLDHPAVRATFAVNEYMPYWTELWPAARMLAKVIVRETWPQGLTAIEIGCGLGLPGIAAQAKGLHVIFTDFDATALRLAADNSRLNGYTDFELLQVDWNYPPENLKVPVVLGSDLIYELRNVEPLVGLIKAVLAPDGVALVTDQDRVPAHALRDTLTREGLSFTTQVVRAGEPGGRRLKGTLYRIRHG